MFRFHSVNNIPNNQGKHLDLSFSNNSSVFIEKSSSKIVLYDPYYPALNIFLPTIYDVPFLNKSHNYFNFQKTSSPEILKFLGSFNWPEIIRNLDVDSAANSLYDALHYCILNFVPNRQFI